MNICCDKAEMRLFIPTLEDQSPVRLHAEEIWGTYVLVMYPKHATVTECQIIAANTNLKLIIDITYKCIKFKPNKWYLKGYFIMGKPYGHNTLI